MCCGWRPWAPQDGGHGAVPPYLRRPISGDVTGLSVDGIGFSIRLSVLESVDSNITFMLRS